MANIDKVDLLKAVKGKTIKDVLYGQGAVTLILDDGTQFNFTSQYKALEINVSMNHGRLLT